MLRSVVAQAWCAVKQPVQRGRSHAFATSATVPQALAHLYARHPPCAISADDVLVLHSPSEFYDALMRHTRASTSKVSIASLYVGTGRLEAAWIEALEQQAANHPTLQVNVCLDHARGLRTGPDGVSSAAALSPLAGVGDRVQVCLFQMPQHRRWLARLLPERVKEGVAVQHAKVYVFDDVVIATGANLSHDYFTNRQDRYVVFRNAPQLARAMHAFVQQLCGVSHRVSHHTGAHAAVALPAAPPPPVDSVGAALRRALQPAQAAGATATTAVVPVMQFAAAGVRDDQWFTSTLLRSLTPSSCLTVATGYLNLPPAYTACLLAAPARRVDVLTAAPQCHGFHGAQGVSAAVPMGYSEIARRFHAAVVAAGRAAVVTLLEYSRSGWTFHAKGMWLWHHAPSPPPSPPPSPQAQPPVVTAVGSPNLGRRSVERDLEVQFVVATTDTALAQRLRAEAADLTAFGVPVTPDTWKRPKRQLRGWSARRGVWIAAAWRLLAPFL